jgi:hypothetical protein
MFKDGANKDRKRVVAGLAVTIARPFSMPIDFHCCATMRTGYNEAVGFILF